MKSAQREQDRAESLKRAEKWKKKEQKARRKLIKAREKAIKLKKKLRESKSRSTKSHKSTIKLDTKVPLDKMKTKQINRFQGKLSDVDSLKKKTWKFQTRLKVSELEEDLRSAQQKLEKKLKF
jgi:hypothetical protein